MNQAPIDPKQATLYLMLGYPGAGKTTAAQTISKLTGARHLWADHERRQLFGTPTYSETENDQLYHRMNQQAAELLAAGQSVVFDTGFNKHADRDHLRAIAEGNDAQPVLVWVTLDPTIARDRATKDAHLHESRTLGDMTDADFERLKEKLEPPAADEPYLELDGTQITPENVAEKLRQQNLL